MTNAERACSWQDAKLPLPKNDQENEDLRVVVGGYTSVLDATDLDEGKTCRDQIGFLL